MSALESMTRRWLSLQACQPRFSIAWPYLQSKIHAAQEKLHKIVAVFEIYEMVEDVNHMPSLDHLQPFRVAT